MDSLEKENSKAFAVCDVCERCRDPAAAELFEHSLERQMWIHPRLKVVPTDALLSHTAASTTLCTVTLHLLSICIKKGEIWTL